jgi:hypothetical protein
MLPATEERDGTDSGIHAVSSARPYCGISSEGLRREHRQRAARDLGRSHEQGSLVGHHRPDEPVLTRAIPEHELRINVPRRALLTHSKVREAETVGAAH